MLNYQRVNPGGGPGIGGTPKPCSLPSTNRPWLIREQPPNHPSHSAIETYIDIYIETYGDLGIPHD